MPHGREVSLGWRKSTSRIGRLIASTFQYSASTDAKLQERATFILANSLATASDYMAVQELCQEAEQMYPSESFFWEYSVLASLCLEQRMTHWNGKGASLQEIQYKLRTGYTKYNPYPSCVGGLAIIVETLKLIREGEEICIVYNSVAKIKKKEDRQQRLWTWLGENPCECTRCIGES